MAAFDPQMIAARWYLNDLAPEDVPEVANRALELGHAGKCLTHLATLVKPSKRDAGEFMDGALHEMGVAAPLTKRDATKWMLNYVRSQAEYRELTSENLVGKLLAIFPELEERYLAGCGKNEFRR